MAIGIYSWPGRQYVQLATGLIADLQLLWGWAWAHFISNMAPSKLPNSSAVPDLVCCLFLGAASSTALDGQAASTLLAGNCRSGGPANKHVGSDENHIPGTATACYIGVDRFMHCCHMHVQGAWAKSTVSGRCSHKTTMYHRHSWVAWHNAYDQARQPPGVNTHHIGFIPTMKQ